MPLVVPSLFLTKSFPHTRFTEDTLMEILRRIGRHEILVDTNKACDISLEETTLQAIPRANGTILSKKQILHALSSGDEYYPISLHWEILDKCNFSCPFCYIVGHSFNRLVRFAEIHPHLSDLVDEGLLFCILTGGEVTLHPDFCDIYTFLKKSGVCVEVFTNGFNLDQRVTDLFVEYPPYTVEISIYSMNNEKMRTMYGAPGDHPADAVLDNVLKLKRLGVHVVCKTFLSTLTSADAGEIARWCDENDVEFYSSSDITPAYDGADLTHFKIHGEAPKKLTVVKEGDKNICFPCGTKNYGCAITSAFEIFPCSSIKHRDCYFDLRKLGVQESLKRMVAFMRRFQDTEIIEDCNSSGRKCKTCIAFSTPIRNDVGEILHFAKF